VKQIKVPLDVEGQALTARACIPSTSGVVVAGQLGKLRPPSVTVMIALGSRLR